ncbi:hypothetical protein N9R81_06560, partial [Flavobacteriales bacterium]|nr:hypothetical protein [Flavobacteriales bacterium]
FSGSISGWQSFEHINAILRNYLDTNEKVSILFMSKDHPVIEQLVQDYPNRIQNKWVAHHEVFSYLSLCDYGMMVREQTITNKVASPVKCAEYLTALQLFSFFLKSLRVWLTI